MSKRAFNLINSKLIHETLEITLQIQNTIEEVCRDTENNLENLPGSLVPTNVLYEIVASFNAMYEKLLVEELLHSGNMYNTSKLTH